MEPLIARIAGLAPLALLLGAILALENIYPYFSLPANRLRHGLRNGFFAAANAIIQALIFGGLSSAVMAWSAARGYGLLSTAGFTGWGAAAIAFLTFDLWMYAWHRANHRLRLLWLFHRAHHNDTAMDATTALRFHPGEIVFSSTLRLGVFALLGMRPEHLALYGAVLLPVIFFHHSNVALPESMDRLLLTFIVSPGMHRVHHSKEPEDLNSNYGSVFSIWDRLFGSFSRRVFQANN